MQTVSARARASITSAPHHQLQNQAASKIEQAERTRQHKISPTEDANGFKESESRHSFSATPLVAKSRRARAGIISATSQQIQISREVNEDENRAGETEKGRVRIVRQQPKISKANGSERQHSKNRQATISYRIEEHHQPRHPRRVIADTVSAIGATPQHSAAESMIAGQSSQTRARKSGQRMKGNGRIVRRSTWQECTDQHHHQLQNQLSTQRQRGGTHSF